MSIDRSPRRDASFTFSGSPCLSAESPEILKLTEQIRQITTIPSRASVRSRAGETMYVSGEPKIMSSAFDFTQRLSCWPAALDTGRFSLNDLLTLGGEVGKVLLAANAR